VTPESAGHLDKAREYLAKARGLIDVLRYSDEAGRAAYLAAFHAAQALISERTGRVARSHHGVAVSSTGSPATTSGSVPSCAVLSVARTI
jgi:uncharacterized protein (UPF0332 family)